MLPAEEIQCSVVCNLASNATLTTLAPYHLCPMQEVDGEVQKGAKCQTCVHSASQHSALIQLVPQFQAAVSTMCSFSHTVSSPTCRFTSTRGNLNYGLQRGCAWAFGWETKSHRRGSVRTREQNPMAIEIGYTGSADSLGRAIGPVCLTSLLFMTIRELGGLRSWSPAASLFTDAMPSRAARTHPPWIFISSAFS